MSRKVIIIGSALAGVGLILLSTVESFLTFFLVYVFIVALGSNAGFFHPVSTGSISGSSVTGVGFSVITASGSIGGMIMAPLLSFIILNYGWRTGAVDRGPHDSGRCNPGGPALEAFARRDGSSPGRPGAVGNHRKGVRPRRPDHRREQLHQFGRPCRTLHFWLLMTCICLRLMVTVALNTHFVPLLVWKGMSEATSAYLVSLFALVSVPLAIGLGWMGDRWNKARLSGLCILPIILAMMGMIFFQGEAILYFFPIAFAFTMGTAPLNWALIGDFFGRGSYATLRGIMGVGYGIATFLSPIYAGWIFDLTESYNIVLLTFSIIMALAAFFFAVLSPPQSPPAKKIPVV